MFVAWVLKTAYKMAFMACLQCAVSHYSELSVVTFVLTKFS